LDQDELDYAALDILQLRALYKLYKSRMLELSHILDESERYSQIWKDERPPGRAWYIDHGILPQEILERPALAQMKHDKLGTKECGGCGRLLHQDSFKCAFERWQEGQHCHTCIRAKRWVRY
jgi:hypothetical protein